MNTQQENQSRQGHAVVVGASMAGLLAARVLADHFERVSILERDELPAVGEQRRAVPQGRHAHALLGSGRNVIEELFPGFVAEILAAGGTSGRVMREIQFVISGHEFTRDADGQDVLLASRPLIEGVVRRRLLSMTNVELVPCNVTGLTIGTGRMVSGVRLAGEGEDHIEADLVAVANGRAGQVPAWLEEHGFRAPLEERLRIDVTYVSRQLRLRPDALGGDRVVLIGAKPGMPRSLALLEQENCSWICTAGGYGAEHRPPLEDLGYLEFLATIAPEEVVAAVAEAEPLTDYVRHTFPDSRRRRYDKLADLPERLVVLGDAVCSFNPLYGQGMSVAALEALELRRCLESGRANLSRRFQKAAAKVVQGAWGQAVGGDLALPEVEGHRSWDVRLSNAYVERLLRTCEHDPVVAKAFGDVSDLLEPPQHILRPAVLWRVLRGGGQRRPSAVPRQEGAPTPTTSARQ